MKTRRILSLILVFLLCISLCSCGMKAKINENYDIAAYIKSTLKTNYNPDIDDAAIHNNVTTCHNAAVRFFEKYQLNPTEEQMSRMKQITKTAYSHSIYTVNDHEKASYGFDVLVEYSVQTSLLNLSEQIFPLVNEMNDNYSVENEKKTIDIILDLCEAAVNAPIYSSTDFINFDIPLARNGDISINLKLFDKLDELILPI